MKRTIAVILMAVLLLLPVLGMTGCAKEKTPVELYALASEKFTEFFSQGMPDGVMGFTDANKITVALKDTSIDAMGENIELPEVNLSGVMADGKVTADIGLSVEDQSISLAGEFGKDGSLTVAIPEATDYYLSGTFDEILEASGAEEADIAEVKKLLSGIEGYMSSLENSDDRFMTEEYIKSEKVDMNIGGTDYKGLTKVTLTVPEADTKAFLLELIEQLGMTEEDLGGEEIALSCEASAILNKEELLRCESKLTVDSKNTVEVTVDLKSEDSTNKADILLAVREGDKDIVKMPVTYSCKVAEGKISGEATVKFESINLDEFADEAEGLIPDIDGEESEATEDAAEMLKGMSFAVEFEGSVSDTASDIDYELKVGVQGVTLTVPFKIKHEFAENKLSTSFVIDASIMGVTLKADLAVTLEKGAAYEGLKLDGGDEIKLAELLDDNDGAWEKLESMGTAFEEFITENDKLTEFFESFMGESEEDYNTAVRHLFIAKNDLQKFSFYSDGTGDISETYEAVTNDEGDLVLSFLDEEVFVITDNGDDTATAGEIEFDCYRGFAEDLYDPNRNNFNVYRCEEQGIVLRVFSDGIAYATYDFEYEQGASFIYITYPGGGEMSFEYEIDEEAGIILIDGVEFEYINYADTAEE